MLDLELRRKVDALWDKFWAGGLANPLTAIDQINYLLFLQRLEAFDDLEARRARAQRVSYSSVFAGEPPTVSRPVPAAGRTGPISRPRRCSSTCPGWCSRG